MKPAKFYALSFLFFSSCSSLSQIPAIDASIPIKYQIDYTGLHYPVECRKDLSQLIDKDIYFISQEQLRDIYYSYTRELVPSGKRVLGLNLYKTKDNAKEAIYIYNELPEDGKEATIHHERCHEYMRKLGKNWVHK